MSSSICLLQNVQPYVGCILTHVGVSHQFYDQDYLVDFSKRAGASLLPASARRASTPRCPCEAATCATVMSVHSQGSSSPQCVLPSSSHVSFGSAPAAKASLALASLPSNAAAIAAAHLASAWHQGDAVAKEWVERVSL